MAETTRTLITDEDVTRWQKAFEAAYGVPLDEEERTGSGEVREALEAVAPGLRARWVAEALEALADEYAPTVQPDGYLSGTAIGSGTLRELAAEYRAGTR